MKPVVVALAVTLSVQTLTAIPRRGGRAAPARAPVESVYVR
jgi:hypothetical protein